MSDMGQVSDGYYTFDELYQHRHLLYCLFLAEDVNAWKSKRHYDEDKTPMDPGWFIAGTELGGLDITYHLPLALWDLCYAEELPYAPEWDGHEAHDVLARMKAYLKDFGEILHG